MRKSPKILIVLHAYIVVRRKVTGPNIFPLENTKLEQKSPFWNRMARKSPVMVRIYRVKVKVARNSPYQIWFANVVSNIRQGIAFGIIKNIATSIKYVFPKIALKKMRYLVGRNRLYI